MFTLTQVTSNLDIFIVQKNTRLQYKIIFVMKIDKQTFLKFLYKLKKNAINLNIKTLLIIKLI